MREPAWRAAKSLLTLRDQINKAAPNRSKASDGLIGDAAHSKSKSDHNPDKDGVVKAMDITHDPGSGVDGTILSESLVASRDPRIQYLIWNGRIINSEVQPWVWRAYSGKNKHDKRVHISVKAAARLYDDTSQWGFQLGRVSQPSPPIRRPEPSQPIRQPDDGDDFAADLRGPGEPGEYAWAKPWWRVLFEAIASFLKGRGR